tara:strand:- start:5326 stop:6135 length:810 start_codon:yes stop_codon:yes gene_type:complete
MKRKDLKRIVERQIKKLYAESLILEDEEKRNAVFNYMTKVLDPDAPWAKKINSYGPQSARSSGRLLKKVFAKFADRSFVDSLITIHWGDAEVIEHALKTVSSKDELSCAAYLPQDVQMGEFGPVGLLIKGHITLLANNMDDLHTGGGERTGVDFPLMKKTSGINKGIHRWLRAVDFKRSVLVLDKEDWNPAVAYDQYRNEALVDNWKAQAIVFSDRALALVDRSSWRKINRIAEQRGLDVLFIENLNDTGDNLVKKEWHPEDEEKTNEP